MSYRAASFSGVDGETGKLCWPPSELHRDEVDQHLASCLERPSFPKLSQLKSGVRPSDFASSGWGVILPRGLAPSILEALDPLTAHRRRQAGRLFKALTGAAAYRRHETAEQFLRTRGVEPGLVQPHQMPYYLLLVGGPEEIPFSFQLELAKKFAVGRIHFSDVESYANYARTIVEIEARGIGKRPSICLFSASHNEDLATQVSSQMLTLPLCQESSNFLSRYGYDWDLDCVVGAVATKQQLLASLTAPQSPSILAIAGHSAQFSSLHASQGALVCSEWTGSQGPETDRTAGIEEFQYFGAQDVDETTNLRGLISLNLSSYSAGRSRRATFRLPWSQQGHKWHNAPHLAPLAQRLLGHAKGGALAHIGQIDRALVCSGGTELQVPIWADMLRNLIAGLPVGESLRRFQIRFAELRVDAALGTLVTSSSPKRRDWNRLSFLLAAENAQTYILVGDPAVRNSTVF